MECEFNHTSYKRRLENYSQHELLTGSMQLRKYSGELDDAFRSTRKSAVLNYEELGGLSDPESRDCAHGVHILG
jgi:hypothetical protein